MQPSILLPALDKLHLNRAVHETPVPEINTIARLPCHEALRVFTTAMAHWSILSIDLSGRTIPWTLLRYGKAAQRAAHTLAEFDMEQLYVWWKRTSSWYLAVYVLVNTTDPEDQFDREVLNAHARLAVIHAAPPVYCYPYDIVQSWNPSLRLDLVGPLVERMIDRNEDGARNYILDAMMVWFKTVPFEDLYTNNPDEDLMYRRSYTCYCTTIMQFETVQLRSARECWEYFHRGSYGLPA